MMDNKQYAKRLFKHYMATTWDHVGLHVDSDNYAEWEDIIDAIIEAAKEEIRIEMRRMMAGE